MLSFFIREFTKRMSSDLPFYYYTLNERYREAEMPSFDVISEKSNASKEHQPRLHKLRINHREDNSILVPGRAMLPIRNKGTIRQRLHKPEMGMPPIPTHLTLTD
jgi:hypothetical protein